MVGVAVVTVVSVVEITHGYCLYNLLVVPEVLLFVFLKSAYAQ